LPAPVERAPGIASLTDLIAPEALHRVQQAFTAAHGAATIVLNAAGEPATRPTGPPGPCELLSGKTGDLLLCGAARDALVRQAADEEHPFLFICGCQLPCFVVPVHAHLARTVPERSFIGCLLVGHARFGTLTVSGPIAPEHLRAWETFPSVERGRLLASLTLVHESLQGMVSAAEQAAVDDLTGLFTWRLFLPMARQAVGEALRYKDALSCVMIDVDRLKQLNAQFDHAGADLVLRELASVVRRTLRRADVIARRYSAGDEFAILLPQTDLRRAVQTAKKIRASVADSKFAVGNAEATATVSLGVSTLNLEAEDADAALTELLDTADHAVTQAKTLGRNCVSAPNEGVVERRAQRSRVSGSVAQKKGGPIEKATIAVLTDGVVLASTESDAQGAYTLSVMLTEQKCEVRCVVDSTPSVQAEPKWIDQRTAVADFRLS